MKEPKLIYQFILPITPVAKGRPRFGNGRTYTPKKTRVFEEQVRLLSKKHAPPWPLSGPIHLKVFFFLKKPKKPKHPKHPISRPDLDNFIKGVKDSLNGLFWDDDSQVILITAGKLYDNPGIHIYVEEITHG